MSNVDFGTDAAGALDLTPTLRAERDPVSALLNRLTRLLSTDVLWYDPDWGHDLTVYVGSATPGNVIETRTTNALIRDEAVRDADVSVTETVDGVDAELTLSIRLRTTFGDLQLTALVSELTVELLLE
ncbi:MAG: hypothetical protein GVY18_09025 [Bacteroidetes bacterium]|jgi:hypothetical protein|nr:hypothetical protein [Bacteroidota bacterium]